MSLPVIVLAGGLATRLHPLTERVPKILIDVAGRPFAEHQIELVRRHGIRDMIYSVGHLGEQVEGALGDGSRWGMRFRYVFDGAQPLGTGGAVRRAMSVAGPTFFVMYGDSYLDCDFSAIETAFRSSGAAGLMTVYRNDDRFDRSNVEYRDGQTVRYDKQQRDPRMRHIDYGLGVLTEMAFAPWAEVSGPFDLAAVYQHLITVGGLAGYEISARFYEIGSPDGLAETRALLARSQGLST